LTEKVVPLHTLAERLERARREGRTVVHCHGVFDLLHVGHIRHLEEARTLGEILVVTVTPDRFVNKGPFRPAFPEDLRAEAVAALHVVDHVALNEWPDAVETIRLLRPNVYVKGPDYRKAEEDVTGGIAREREAVEAAGGRLHVTDGVTFSSTQIINRRLSRMPPETQDYLTDLAFRYPAKRILECLGGVRDLKVLVVGEAIIDEYQYGQALGMSAKDPILAVKMMHAERFAGGILAVANNVAQFCRAPAVLAMLGETASHEAFIRESLHRDVRPIFFHRTASPTVVKRRIIEHYSFTKLLSLYDWNNAPLEEKDRTRLHALLEEVVGGYDLVLVVDYGHSMMIPATAEIIARRARFLAVNVQSNAGNLGYQSISKYPRADLLCIAEAEMRQEMRDPATPSVDLLRSLVARYGYPRVIVTRGKLGCLYGEAEGAPTPFRAPALADRVTDRMGGGDAFLSVAAPCAAAGVPPEVICFLGNAAAAQAVATVGHRSSIDPIALRKTVESLLK
jgi:rfaE bifunctional protein nucleotidyltransferase chain/domain